jgi:hypothetical protein
MIFLRALLLPLLVAGAAPPAAASSLDRITQAEAVQGLKTALEQGAQAAVKTLGRADGFLKDRRVKIPLPESMRRAERLMRQAGAGRYADELIVAMNRAAEAAVPQAQAVFVEAVKKMSVQDAKKILTGGSTAGTDYFRRTTRADLYRRFLPIAKRATAKVKLAQTYQQYATHAASFGLVKKDQVDLDAYVANKALDGLYFMVAEEEKKIRRDPARSGKAILKKVFGALR